MAENPSVKKYYDYAQQQVDEQAIADKFNAATTAQFNVQREQNRQAENQFYNQMYNTQRTAMDTIRQSNAAAVSNGASRGVQAANELSALLGLQEQSVASATELAQANRQTAQEETAAVLENMLNAYQQAVTERQQLVQQGIESASVDASQEANAIAAQDAATNKQKADTETAEYMRNLHTSDPNEYYRLIAQQNNVTDFANMTDAQYTNNVQIARDAATEITNKVSFNEKDFTAKDSGAPGSSKVNAIRSDLQNLYVSYGLTAAEASEDLEQFSAQVKASLKGGINWQYYKDGVVENMLTNYINNRLTTRYNAKYTANKQTK